MSSFFDSLSSSSLLFVCVFLGRNGERGLAVCDLAKESSEGPWKILLLNFLRIDNKPGLAKDTSNDQNSTGKPTSFLSLSFVLLLLLVVRKLTPRGEEKEGKKEVEREERGGKKEIASYSPGERGHCGLD